MRKKIPLALVIILLLITVFPCLSYAEGNLAKNPSFEEGTDVKPSDWETAIWDKKVGVSELKVENGAAHSGNKFVTVINNSVNDARFKQLISVKGNTNYKLSCWIKTENVGTNQKGANISLEGKLESSKDIRGTNGNWQYSEMYAKTSKDITSIIVTVGIGGYGGTNTGKASFDDVSVEEVSSIPSGAVVASLGNENQSNSTSTSNNVPLKSSSKTTIIILILAAVVVIGGGIGFYKYVNRKSAISSESVDGEESSDEANKENEDENLEFEDNNDEKKKSDNDLI